MSSVRTTALTAAALIAFASNSILCRMALGRGSIDAASFSSIRLAAGACMLAAIVAWTRPSGSATQGSWTSGVALFLYAIPFSLSYQLLTTGTGALILFGTVQVTMLLAALVSGERPHVRQWLGALVATVGLVYLVLPGLAAPSLAGAGLMALAGVAWGIYSIRGRGAVDPVAHTASNFVFALPFAFAVSGAAIPWWHLELDGVLLAIVSGAVASGLGYIAWYAALRGLSATRASLVQLPVPVLTALGGIVVLGEPLSQRLLVSGMLVIGGFAVALAARERIVSPSRQGQAHTMRS